MPGSIYALTGLLARENGHEGLGVHSWNRRTTDIGWPQTAMTLISIGHNEPAFKLRDYMRRPGNPEYRSDGQASPKPYGNARGFPIQPAKQRFQRAPR